MDMATTQDRLDTRLQNEVPALDAPFKGQWPQTTVTNLELLTHSEAQMGQAVGG